MRISCETYGLQSLDYLLESETLPVVLERANRAASGAVRDYSAALSTGNLVLCVRVPRETLYQSQKTAKATVLVYRGALTIPYREFSFATGIPKLAL